MKIYKPTIRDMFNLPFMAAGHVNPAGDKILYALGHLDNFRDNKFEAYLYVHDLRADQTYQFTKTNRAINVKWVNNQTIAFLMSVDNNDFQIHVCEGLIGEGRPITDHPGCINDYKLFSNGFVYSTNNSTKFQVERKKKYGNIIDMEEEERTSILYYVDREKMLNYSRNLKKNNGKSNQRKPVIDLSQFLDKAYKIDSINCSPNNDCLFINCRPNDEGIYEDDISLFKIQFNPKSILNVENDDLSSSIKITQLNLVKNARIKTISPDGSKLLISQKEKGSGEEIQSDLWILNLRTTEDILSRPELQDHLVCITKNLDQEPLETHWTKLGIFVSYWDVSICKIAKFSESGDISVCDTQGLSPSGSFSINPDGYMCIAGISPNTIAEIYFGIPKKNGWDLKRITNFSKQIENWDLGIVESIKWTSKDGTVIEGVLRKPSNFDSKKKYPLLFYIHGGPSWVSPCISLTNAGGNRYFYPVTQLLNKDIIILEPNYRGSLGRGKDFLALNYDNLGVGDMWDLESAIDFLVEQGFIDESRIGSMGWSQGGYIGCYAAMHTNRFKAVSAGAALCDWRVYFSGSDMRHSILLSGNPYTNKEKFEETAPISAINKAQTPILFQHGEKDPRVPLISAMEMYRALKERGVNTRLIVYQGCGHGVLSPRENYALMVQNYRWFVHYLLGEELDLYMDDEGKKIPM